MGKTGTARVLVIFFVLILFFPVYIMPAGTISEINVVIDDNYPPYSFREKNGELVGISIDHWKLWEKKTGIKVNIEGLQWSSAFEKMDTGKADVIDSIFKTPERQKKYLFTHPYAVIEVPVFFHKDISGIRDIESLHGFKIGVKTNDACIEVLKKNGITEMTEYSDYAEIIAEAAAGMIKVFCVDKPPAIYYLNKRKIEDDFKYSMNLYTGAFHRAVNKNRTELLAVVEKGFNAISAEEYKKTDVAWRGAEIISRRELILFLSIFVALSFFVFMVLFVWNKSLKNEVDKKTKEIKITLDELRLSENRFKAIFESSFDFVGLLTADGSIIDANKRSFDIFSGSFENVKGIKIWDVPWRYINEADNKQLKYGVEEASKGKIFRYETSIRFSDGREIKADVSISPVMGRDGRVEMIVIEARDITDIFTALEAVKVSEEKFRSLAEQQMMGIVIVKEGKVVFANKGFCDLSAIDYKEAQMLTLGGFLAKLQDENGVVTEERFKECRHEITCNLILRDNKGEATWVAVNKKDIMFENSAATLINIIDISQVIEAQKKLEITVEELLKSNEELEKFAYVASHDLQEPLRMIYIYSELLIKKYGTDINAEGKEYLDNIMNGALRLRQLIKDLLEYSRVGNKSKAEPFTDVDMNEVVQTCIMDMNAAIQESNIKISKGNLPVIRAAKTQMLRLMENLTGNAVKFTRNVKEPEITISAEKKGNEWEFCVKDNGIGIEEEYKEKIFEIFEKLHSRDEYEGTGIGLAVCRKIVTQHKGKIWVSSRVNEGAAFYFTVPAD
ncbi:MAG: transporter substrate-binding domain-containing protein [Candidatus Goldbacteria bacterium]|nr:transporter substrate-binding domain-containing protein [Candidatus Goldiibacteriota bacterium]